MQLSKKSYIELFNSEMHTVQCALYPRQLQMALKNWDFHSITVTLIYEQVHQKAADCENVTCMNALFTVIPLTTSFQVQHSPLSCFLGI